MSSVITTIRNRRAKQVLLYGSGAAAGTLLAASTGNYCSSIVRVNTGVNPSTASCFSVPFSGDYLVHFPLRASVPSGTLGTINVNVLAASGRIMGQNNAVYFNGDANLTLAMPIMVPIRTVACEAISTFHIVASCALSVGLLPSTNVTLQYMGANA
jgi:hypothetical protein